MIPPRFPSDKEDRIWVDPSGTRAESGLEGKVVSFDDLTRAFPANRIIGSNLGPVQMLADLSRKYIIYGQNNLKDGMPYGYPNLVAHGCNECDSIIVGPPKIEDLKFGVGGEGYRVSCGNCNVELYKSMSRTF